MKILIMGYGNIGRHIEQEFKLLKDCITIYDKYKEPYNDESILKELYDFVFICVPTEMEGSTGKCDTSEVYEAVYSINKNKPYDKKSIIIIKSAIPCGYSHTELYARGHENVIVSPEYYGTTQHSLASPDFIIIGGHNGGGRFGKEMSMKVANLYYKVKGGSFRCIFTDCRTAELAKYMENCWIATKVTFCNEFAEIAKSKGINYEELRECFVADERVSPWHTFVYPDQPYYDSHCLNKDIPALIQQCTKCGQEPKLMMAVNEINNEKKTNAR